MNGRFAEVAESYGNLKLALAYYDGIQKKAAEIFVEKLEESFSRLVGVYQIIELGFGTAETTNQVIVAAENAGIKINLTAIDNERKMFRQVQSKSIAHSATFLLAEADEFLTRQPREYHGIITGYMMHNLKWSELDRLSLSMLSQLVSGGVFVNLDKIALDNPVAHLKNLAVELRSLEVLLEQCGDDYWAYWFQHYLEDETHPLTEEKLRRLLTNECAGRLKELYFSERHGMAAICVAVKE